MTRRQALAGLGSSAALLNAQKSLVPATPARPTALKNITVIDGIGQILQDQTVLVEADRITAIGPAAATTVPGGAHLVNGRNKFLIPGLCDAHAHLSYFKASALSVLLANGVTSIRDMGGLLGEIDRWKAQTDSGVRPGPRIFRAGPILNGKAFNQFQVAVLDAPEARGAVRVLRNADVDFVKVHAATSRDAYFAVQAECHQLDLPYVGHMPRAITPEEASDAGQLTLEHIGAFADRFASAGVPADQVAEALARFRQNDAPALFARFARNRTWFTPTLIASKLAIHLADRQPDQRDKYVSASCKKITEDLLKRPSYQALFTPAAVHRQQREFEQLPLLVKLLHQSGVGLLAGTDFAVSVIYPGFSLHEELALLVESGLTPMQSLLTATANPARVLGQTDLGTIEAGKLADLVVLDANPMDDIRNTTKISAVVSRGQLFNRAALDQLLTDAEVEARTT